ncbi:Peptide methionine sulfoxide reductase MsrA [Diplonema papillatum]|nr:Peptide methionine sulfoxide reductase MsrA [Diplonema papillatum]
MTRAVFGLALFFTAAAETAIFSCGCFWQAKDSFELAGVSSVTVGYIGGWNSNPTQVDVLKGTTGHAEAVLVTYNSSEINYRDLVNVFFRAHDASSLGAQGLDIGWEGGHKQIFRSTMDPERLAAQEAFAQAMATNKLPDRVIPMKHMPLGPQGAHMQKHTARESIERYTRKLLQIVANNRRLDQSHNSSMMTVPKLFQVIAHHFHVPEWRRLNTSIDSIPSLSEYVRKCKTVDNTIHAIFACRDAVTLFEVEREVCALHSVKAWENLGLLHGVHENPCVVQYYGVELAKRPPRLRVCDLLAFVYGQPDEMSISEMLLSFARSFGFECEKAEDLGVWIRDLPSFVEMMDSERRRVTQAAATVGVRLEEMSKQSAAVAKWVVGLLSMPHRPEAGNPLLSVRSRSVRRVFISPQTASAQELSSVVGAVHKLLHPAIDEEWVSDSSASENEDGAGSSRAQRKRRRRSSALASLSSSASSSSSSSSAATSGSAGLRTRRRKKLGDFDMATRLERKIDRQQKKLQKRALKRSDHALAKEQRAIVEAHVKRAQELEAYANFGVATRAEVVATIARILKRVPVGVWQEDETVKLVEKAVEDAHSGTIDAVCHKVGPFPSLFAEAAVSLLAGKKGRELKTQCKAMECSDDEDDGPRSDRNPGPADETDPDAALLPLEERREQVGKVVQTACQEVCDRNGGSLVAGELLTSLASVEKETLRALSQAMGKPCVGFHECKLTESGSFVEFVTQQTDVADFIAARVSTHEDVRTDAVSLLRTTLCVGGKVQTEAVEGKDIRVRLAPLLLSLLPVKNFEPVVGKLSGGIDRLIDLSSVSCSETNTDGGPSNWNSHLDALAIKPLALADLPEYKVRTIAASAVVKRIEALPPLTEVRSALQWDDLLQPSFGSLEAFLSVKGIAFATGGRLWKRRADEVFKLPAGQDCSIDAFKAKIAVGDGVGAAGCLVAMFAQGSVALELLAAYVQTALEKLPGDHQRVQCVRSAMVALPRSTALLFAKTVFLTPLASLVHGATVAVYQGAARDEREALSALGCLLDIAAWRSSYEASFHDGIQQAPAPPTQTATQDPTATEASNPPSAPPAVTNGNKTGNEEKANDLDKQKLALSHRKELAAGDISEEGQPEAVVQNILRSEFGVGADMTDEGKLLHDTSSRRLGRAIERLASDLYSSDVHFVLELIQNADDNKYPSGALPTLRFDLGRRSVVVSNNEVGFSAKNIRALCDVGSSTKTNADGYIGMKGIGFKSVFRVTTAPEVHSSGYHISFDLSIGPMGYILPTWLGDDGTRESARSDRLAVEEGPHATQVVLPLSAEMATEDRREVLLSKLDDIHPSLLLFVRKLRRIVIRDHVRNMKREMVRTDREDNVVEVSVNGTPCRWLLQRLSLVPEIMRTDSRGAQKRTELALAFPLRDESDPHRFDTDAEEMMVFAFLPLRACGLKFVLQGDWTIPSSREDVDAGSPWNQWLRSHVAPLFVSSLEAFKSRFSSAHEALSSFLTYVPCGSGVVGFFRPLVDDIKRHMLETKCLVTVDGHWERPVNIVVVPEVLETEHCRFTEVVASGAFLQEAIGKRCLHQSVVMTGEVAQHLGLDMLDLSHLLRIVDYQLKQIAIGAERNEPLSRAAYNTWLSRWLLCVQACLDGHCGAPLTGTVRAALLSKLRALKMIPLCPPEDPSGADLARMAYPLTLASVEEGGIFFGAETEAKTGYAVFLAHMRVIDPALHTSVLEGGPRVMLKDILSLIGVRPLSPSDVISKFVAPMYRENRHLEAPDDLLFASIRFVKDNHAAVSPVLVSQLSECIALHTNAGLVKPREATVLFPGLYGNKHALENAHLKYQTGRSNSSSDNPAGFVLVSEQYLTLGEEEELDVSGWVALLEKFGVKWFFTPVAKRVAVADYRRSKWAGCPWPHALLSAEIDDFEAPELEAVLQRLTDLEQQHRGTNLAGPILSCLRCIAELLDAEWYSFGYHRASHATFAGAPSSSKAHLPSSFALCLQTHPWLPTSHGTLEKPQGLLLDGQRVSLLRGAVPVLVIATHNKAFIELLGVRVDVTPVDVLQALHHWSKEAQFAPFAASLEDMRALYDLLATACESNIADRGSVTSAFRKTPLIYLPNKDFRTFSQPASVGSFYALSDVCWEDPVSKPSPSRPETFVSIPQLAKAYPGLHDFFVDTLVVTEQPSTQRHIDFLIEFGTRQMECRTVPGRDLSSYVLRCAAQLSDDLASGAKLPATVVSASQRKKLAATSLFCTSKSEADLVAAEQGVVVNDIKNDWAAALGASTQIHVLQFTEESGVQCSDAKAGLLAAFDIKPLSELADVTVLPSEVDWEATGVLRYELNRALPFVQRFILSEMPKLAVHLLREDAAVSLCSTGVRSVSAVRCNVTVRDVKNKRQAVTEAEPEFSVEYRSTASVVCAHSVLYAKTTHTKQYSKHFEELFLSVLKATSAAPEDNTEPWAPLLEFAHRVVLQLASDPRGVEVYMMERNIKPLPPSAHRWELAPVPTTQEQAEIFPAQSGNPATARPDGVHNIRVEDLDELDQQITDGLAEDEQNQEDETAPGSRTEKYEDDGTSLAGTKRKAKGQEPDSEDQPKRKWKGDSAKGKGTGKHGARSGKGSKQDSSAAPQDGRAVPQDELTQFGADGGREEAAKAASSKPPADVIADAIDVPLHQRPLIMILRLWLKQGKLHPVVIVRNTEKEKLGLQFVPGTLIIKGHVPNTPASKFGAELPPGFHVLACNGTPLKFVVELKVQLQLRPLVTLLVGIDPFPEDPTAFLEKSKLEVAELLGTPGAGPGGARKRRQDGEDTKDHDLDAMHTSEASVGDLLRAQAAGAPLPGGGKGKGKKGGGGKKGKHGKARAIADSYPERVAAGETPLFSPDGKLLGFLAKEGSFASVQQHDSNTHDSRLPEASPNQDFQAHNEGSNSNIFCFICGSSAHLARSCPTASRESNDFHAMDYSWGSKGAPSATGSGKSGTGKPGTGKGGKGKGGKGAGGKKEFSLDMANLGREVHDGSAGGGDGGKGSGVMKIQPYFDPETGTEEDREAVLRNIAMQDERMAQGEGGGGFGPGGALGSGIGGRGKGQGKSDGINEEGSASPRAGKGSGGKSSFGPFEGGGDSGVVSLRTDTETKKRKVAPNVYDPSLYKDRDTTDDQGVLEKIGRWGEQYVFRYLRRHADPLVDHVWVNEVEETGAAYDIVERRRDPSTGIISVTYIEVKATAAVAKMFFQFTYREMQFAQANGQSFHVYRVFSAGTDAARIMVIRNPIAELKKGTISVSGSLCVTLRPENAQKGGKKGKGKGARPIEEELPQTNGPQSMFLHLTRSASADPTGLNVKKDLTINKHPGDPRVTASAEAPVGWKIVKVNGIAVASVADLKKVLQMGDLNLSIQLEEPPLAPL